MCVRNDEVGHPKKVGACSCDSIVTRCLCLFMCVRVGVGVWVCVYSLRLSPLGLCMLYLIFFITVLVGHEDHGSVGIGV